MEAPGGKPWRQLGPRTLPHTGPDRLAGPAGGWCQQTLALREKPAVHAVRWPTCVTGCWGRWLWCAQWGCRPPREVGLNLALDFLSTYPSPEHRQLAPLHTWEPSETQHGRADAFAGPARGGMLGRPDRWGPIWAAFKGPRGSETTAAMEKSRPTSKNSASTVRGASLCLPQSVSGCKARRRALVLESEAGAPALPPTRARLCGGPG